ncbi:MAG: DUF1592 domain-containing protein [Verrucomicrobiales bacterium]
MTLRPFIAAFLAPAALALAVSAPGAPVGDPAIAAFFESHCVKCHGPDKQKGDLRLDTLAAPASRDDEAWLAILDVLEAGDMPPIKEPRPEPAKVAHAVAAVGEALAAAGGERGLALRRMNRVEYENTVQDLLGIDTPLAELLPEDSSVQGFDNVADGLGLSAILMERYLEAADAAFDGVIRRIKPLPPEARRALAMEQKENIASVKENKGGTIQVADSFVKFTPGWPPARLDPAHPIEDGMYRCRVAVWPHDPSDRTLVIAAYVGPLFGPGKRDFAGMFDVTGTPEKPRVIEFTVRMEAEEAIHLEPWVFPEHITWRDKDEPRPGIGIAWAETYGPLDQDFPSKAQRRLFGEGESIRLVEGNPIWMRHRKGVKEHFVESDAPREDAERIIREFLPRAFRRPIDPEEAEPFVRLTLERLDEGRTFEQAVRAGVTAVLCAPQFLLVNRDPEVDAYTVASRLSYFLWSSMPDGELLDLAAQGKLGDPQVRHAQVERMLRDPKAERFVVNFTGQWLDLRQIEFTTPDKKLFPEFDKLLQESMLGETRGFFRHILENDLSVMNFVDSDFACLNERLADHYGIGGVKGHEEFRIVKLPGDSIRGGVLTQASVLKVTANGTNTSPVLRGVWVLDNLLGQPAPPPPPGVPAVEPDIRGATTLREQLDKHRNVESCARCHVRIDPPGFALESFNPIGGFREWYRSLGEGKKVEGAKVNYRQGRDVDPTGDLPGSGAFASFAEFRQQLMGREDQVARAIATKLLIYATGRRITAADRPAIEAVVAKAKADHLGLRAMIHAVTDSELFYLP